MPNESAIVRAVEAPSVTRNLLASFVGTLAGTVVLVVLVTEVSVAEHSLDKGINPFIGAPGQPVLPCW